MRSTKVGMMGDRNGHISSCLLDARLHAWALRPDVPMPPALENTLSQRGAAHNIRRGPQPCQNGGCSVAMVLWEAKEGVQLH